MSKWRLSIWIFHSFKSELPITFDCFTCWNFQLENRKSPRSFRSCLSCWGKCNRFCGTYHRWSSISRCGQNRLVRWRSMEDLCWRIFFIEEPSLKMWRNQIARSDTRWSVNGERDHESVRSKSGLAKKSASIHVHRFRRFRRSRKSDEMIPLKLHFQTA